MTKVNCWGDSESYDYASLTDSLYKYLKIKTLPVCMKRFRVKKSLIVSKGLKTRSRE